MPGVQIPDFVPPSLTRWKDEPTVQPNTLPLAPTQPESPAEYDGPDFISRLETAGISKDDAIKGLLRRINLQRAPKRIIEHFETTADQTDGSGNLVHDLFEVPFGFMFAVHSVTVAVNSLATYTPNAPYTGGYMFLARSTSSGGGTKAQQITSLWPAVLAFAPTSSGGPFLPGQWTFGTHDSPKVWGGSKLFIAISTGPATQSVTFTTGGRLVETA